jgi:hypothetical protein
MLNIESEGFVFKYSDKHTSNKAYTKPYDNHPTGYSNVMVDVVYNPQSDWVLICQGDEETCWSDWKTMFCGRVKTQEDFKKVLELVII